MMRKWRNAVAFFGAVHLGACTHAVVDGAPDPQAEAAPAQQSEEEQWLEGFRAYMEAGTSLDYAPSAQHPWGRLNPDAPPETEQFAFMVGEFDCAVHLTGINPHSEDGAIDDRLVWRTFYAFDGRGIRDQYYQGGGLGQQFRLYDEEAGEWQVTFAATRGVIDLGGPSPSRGEFVARQAENGDMEMFRDQVDQDGRDYVQRITFYEIAADSFRWKSDLMYPEETVSGGGGIDCRRTAGPNMG